MKVIGNIEEKLETILSSSGVLVDVQPYNVIKEGLISAEEYGAIVVDIDDKDAEGVYSPRVLTGKHHTVPVIGLSYDSYVPEDSTWEEYQTTFLEQGGMYLLRDPVHTPLLLACIRRATNISKGLSPGAPVLWLYENRLRVDMNTSLVYFDKNRLSLTIQETNLLCALARANGRVCSNDYLMSSLYPDTDREPEQKIIDVFICKARKKLDDCEQGLSAIIETIWGRGYRLRNIPQVSTQQRAS